MPLLLDWKQITLRLALTVLAGLVIGLNRSEHGRPAGMRTTLLVCLAASLSMIQANLLLPTVGKAADSFVVLDLMRLPLGVLSGMGFIGAGTILRKGNLVTGVTTAATLWFVTLMGLCFGGGQIALGLAALALGWATLWGLKYVEKFLRQDVRASLELTILRAGPGDEEIRRELESDGCAISAWGIAYQRDPEQRTICCQIQWRQKPGNTRPPAVIEKFHAQRAITSLRWEPQYSGDASAGGSEQNKPRGTPIPISPAE